MSPEAGDPAVCLFDFGLSVSIACESGGGGLVLLEQRACHNLCCGKAELVPSRWALLCPWTLGLRVSLEVTSGPFSQGFIPSSKGCQK